MNVPLKPPQTQHLPDTTKGLIAGLLVVACWSGFNIVSRLGGRSPLTPYDMAAVRFVFSGIVCLPFVLARWRRLEWPRLAVLAAFLYWEAQGQDWLALQATPWLRVLWLGLCLLASGVIYLGTLWAVRLDLRALLRR